MGQTLKEGGRELQLKALEAVKERLLALYADEGKILHPELNDQTLDVLTAVLTRFGEHLDTCLGEFFFRPVDGDPDEGQYFTVLITLRNDIPVENVPELAYALGIINFYVETGCFTLNKPADLLVYKNTRIFAGDTHAETMIKDCVLLMESAYETASKYCTPVFALAEGSMGLMEFMESIRTGY